MWTETWDAWKILYPLGLCSLPQSARTNPARRKQDIHKPFHALADTPPETQGWDHRCRLRPDGFQSGRALAWACGEKWASSGHNEGLRIY
jgi:hypothetical protein